MKTWWHIEFNEDTDLDSEFWSIQNDKGDFMTYPAIDGGEFNEVWGMIWFYNGKPPIDNGDPLEITGKLVLINEEAV